MLRHEELALHGQIGLRKRAVYKEDSWSSDVMTIYLIAAINLVSPPVTNVIDDWCQGFGTTLLVTVRKNSFK